MALFAQPTVSVGADSLAHEGARGVVFGLEIGLVVAAVGGIVATVRFGT